jgi:outer membrane protein insertion porin family
MRNTRSYHHRSLPEPRLLVQTQGLKERLNKYRGCESRNPSRYSLRRFPHIAGPSGLSSGNHPLRDNPKFSGQQLLQRFLKSVPIVLALLFVSSTPCRAQQPVMLRRIEFVGLKRLTGQQVIDASGLKVGDSVTREAIDAASEKLMQSGLFRKLGYKIHTANNEVTLIFEVEEASRNLPVVFENFVWFSEDEIARAIRQDVPFFDGTAPEAGTTTDKIAAALQRLLSQKRISGRVKHMPYLAKGRQEILFTVEGVKIPMCSLHFPGATAISEADLIKASQALLKSDYSRKNAGVFADYTLFPLYRHLGHLRAQFQQPTAALEESPSQCAGGVAVTIPVDEGVVYSWAAAEWSGNQALTQEELSAALGMKAGEIADGLKIDKGLKDASKAYGRRGYIAAGIKESVEFDDAARHVSYRIGVTEGPRYFMGKLMITGLSPEDAELLKAKWTLGSNAVFDESYIDNFRQTGLREFMTGLRQRSPGSSGLKIEIETKPDAKKQTVDVIISFK